MKKMKFKRILAMAMAAALSAGAMPAIPVSAFAGETTPEENVFSIGGKEFILLDSEGEGSGKYLVLSRGFAGGLRYYAYWDDSKPTSESYNKWEQTFVTDGSDPNHIGYWLNTEYLEDNTYLPAANGKNMADYIPVSDWATEAGCSANCSEAYTVTAKVVVPSVTELEMYDSRIGYKDEEFSGFWWTRSPWVPTWKPVEADMHAMKIVKADGTINRAGGGKGYIRPIFRLTNEFFDDMPISLMTAGENVLEVIRSNYTDEQLSDIYDSKTLDWLRGRTEPSDPAAVSEVVLSGTPATCETLSVSYTPNSVCDDSRTQIEWEIAAETADGVYGAYKKAGSGAEITLNNSMVTKIADNGDTTARVKIRAKITPYTADGIVGETAYSDELVTEPALGPIARGFTRPNITPNSPATNVFIVDGREFVLLDTFTENGVRSYFVIANDAYGKRAIDVDAGWDLKGDNNFTPDDRKQSYPMEKKHMAYWLNSSEEGGFLNDASEQTLPTGIKAYIDMNRRWKTEASAERPNDYCFTAGVTLLSAREYQKYAEKIGYADLGDNWWLRTGYKGENAKNMYFKYGSAIEGEIERNIGKYENFVRPVFYLKDDFFRNVKLTFDVNTLGDNIKAMLVGNYTEQELKAAGYSDEELDLLYDRVTVKKPTVSSVSISGTGDTTTYMTASAVCDELTAATNFQWQVSTDGKNFANITAAPGAATDTLYVNNKIASVGTRGNPQNTAYYNVTRYVRVQVTPVSADGIIGDSVYSEPFKMPEALGPVSYRTSTLAADMPEKASEDDIFTIGDKKFILLDRNENGEFFVFAADSYGNSVFDANNGQIYTTDADIGKYVVTTAFETLPAAVGRHAVEKVWRTEGGNINGTAPEDSAVTAKAALISFTELEKYAAKIGMKDVSGVWSTRSPDGHYMTNNDAGAKNPIIVLNANGTTGGYASTYGMVVRPALYLDKDFFIDAKITPSAIGKNVREAMLQAYTVEELKSIYTIEELDKYFGVGSLSLENARLTAVTGNDKEIEVSVRSWLENDEDVILIAAVYDGETLHMKGAASKAFKAAAGEVSLQNITVSNSNPAENDIITVMVWKGWEQMTPMCSPITVE